MRVAGGWLEGGGWWVVGGVWWVVRVAKQWNKIPSVPPPQTHR